jgi:hypothetical protein
MVLQVIQHPDRESLNSLDSLDWTIVQMRRVPVSWQIDAIV